MSTWVVRDERSLDAEALASAVASQGSLGDLIARLRAVRYEELPVPTDGQGVAP